MNSKMTPEGNSTFALVQLLGLFFLAFLVITSIFAYILVETRTRLYIDEISNVEKVCGLNNNTIKFVKVLDYQKYKDYAKVYCGYKNSGNNRILEVNYRKEEWRIVLDTKVNKEKSLHWPIYF